MMSVIESFMTRREKRRAERGTLLPSQAAFLRTIVIGCADPRVDPGHVLGLRDGEAAVIRNIGGRVTSATLATLAMLRQLCKGAGGDLAEGWNLVLLHHTDCGIQRLHSPPDLVAEYLGVARERLSSQALDDPHASLRLDVQLLRDAVDFSQHVLVSGLSYDVATGEVELVVSPTAFVDKGVR
jgi:carbonic anhydrase